jgi:competence protein ComEC
MGELPQPGFPSAPLFVLAGALASGILISSDLSTGSLKGLLIGGLVTAVTVFLSAWCTSRNHYGLAAILISGAFVLVGIGLQSLEQLPKPGNRIVQLFDRGALLPATPAEITGVIEGQPEDAPQSLYLTLRAEQIRLNNREREVTGTVLLLAGMRDEENRKEYDVLELRHGARVRVMTSLDREENFRNPGVLPFTEYLERKGFDATGVVKSPLLIERLDDERVFLPLAWLYEWRERLENEFARRFSPETAGVLEAAVLGNRYNLSQAAADRFRTGGTFHVLVISGLHIGFIGGLVYILVRWFTKRRRLQFLISASFLWAYTIAVGAQAPVARAALMFTLVIFAPLVWRRANSLNAIGGAMLALLVWRPGDLFDPSLQLTFTSVLSIILIAAPLLQRMETVGSWRPTHASPYPSSCSNWFRNISEVLFWSEREWRAEMMQSNVQYRIFKHPFAARLEQWRCQRLLRFAAAAIIVSASVQIGMLPLLVIYFHRISFVSLFLNIFIGGLLAAVALLALAAVLISQVSAWAAAPLVALVEKTDWLMIHLVDPLARAGIAAMRLPHYSGWKAIIYISYFVALGFLIIALAHWKPLHFDSNAPKKSILFSALTRRCAGAVFVLVFATVIFHPFCAGSTDGKLHIDFLDVGQGDSALVTMPDGTTLLIDGGGRPNINWNQSDESSNEAFERDRRSVGEAVVSEYLWSQGLDRVDYILATHADADHIDGLNDVARNFKVRGAIVARTPADDAEFVRFADTMKVNRVPIDRVGTGDVLRFGAVCAEVLWPPATADTNSPYDNNNGLVIKIHYGEKVFLFLADIEKESEAALLRFNSDLVSDVVKVAHHGSKTSSVEPFVVATRPRLAIISVGRTSIFGHPNKEVVNRWRASGAQVMTTGEKGAISIMTDGRALDVSTFVR